MSKKQEGLIAKLEKSDFLVTHIKCPFCGEWHPVQRWNKFGAEIVADCRDGRVRFDHRGDYMNNTWVDGIWVTLWCKYDHMIFYNAVTILEFDEKTLQVRCECAGDATSCLELESTDCKSCYYNIRENVSFKNKRKLNFAIKLKEAKSLKIYRGPSRQELIDDLFLSFERTLAYQYDEKLYVLYKIGKMANFSYYLRQCPFCGKLHDRQPFKCCGMYQYIDQSNYVFEDTYEILSQLKRMGFNRAVDISYEVMPLFKKAFIVYLRCECIYNPWFDFYVPICFSDIPELKDEGKLDVQVRLIQALKRVEQVFKIETGQSFAKDKQILCTKVCPNPSFNCPLRGLNGNEFLETTYRFKIAYRKKK